jgi:hypothetical protein
VAARRMAESHRRAVGTAAFLRGEPQSLEGVAGERHPQSPYAGRKSGRTAVFRVLFGPMHFNLHDGPYYQEGRFAKWLQCHGEARLRRVATRAYRAIFITASLPGLPNIHNVLTKGLAFRRTNELRQIGPST